MLRCFGVCRIFQVLLSQKQSAFDAFIMSVIAHPKDIIPRRGLDYSRKYTTFFLYGQGKSLKNAK